MLEKLTRSLSCNSLKTYKLIKMNIKLELHAYQNRINRIDILQDIRVFISSKL